MGKPKGKVKDAADQEDDLVMHERQTPEVKVSIGRSAELGPLPPGVAEYYLDILQWIAEELAHSVGC